MTYIIKDGNTWHANGEWRSMQCNHHGIKQLVVVRSPKDRKSGWSHSKIFNRFQLGICDCIQYSKDHQLHISFEIWDDYSRIIHFSFSDQFNERFITMNNIIRSIEIIIERWENGRKLPPSVNTNSIRIWRNDQTGLFYESKLMKHLYQELFN